MSVDSTRVAAIVLAAGESKRMGSNNKLMSQLAGKTLLQHVLTNLGGSMVNQVIVVGGHESNRLIQSISQYDVQYIENKYYKDGVSSSIKSGINQLDDSIEASFICQADMPRVTANVIDQMIMAYIENQQIIRPYFQGKKGNPLLWPRRYFNKLLKLSGDTGGQQILTDLVEEIVQLEVHNAGVLWDIDDAVSLESMRAKFE